MSSTLPTRSTPLLAPKAVIVAATDKCYGRHENLPYTEEHPLKGTQQVYETSKVCEDVIAQMAAFSWGLPIGITRFGNVYGPDDHHMSRIVPYTIDCLINHKKVHIRSNGQHYRDFVYIEDVVSGYLMLADYVAHSGTENPAIFNFGTGVPARVLDIVTMISIAFNCPPDVQVDSWAEDEIHKQYVDATKANIILGWKPEVRLRDGIQNTIDWYKEKVR